MIDSPQSLEGIDDLLSQLTADELRDVVLLLRGPEEPLGRKKEELVRAASTAAPVQRVEEVAARVEALSPRKHLWLSSITGDTPIPANAALRQRLAEVAKETRFRRIQELERGSPELQLRLSISNERTGSLYLKYEHWVRTAYWVKIGPTVKELREETVRHPVTVVIRPDHGICETRFDGFSQGLATAQEDRMPYRRVAEEAATAAASLCGFAVTHISLASAVERLLDSLPEEVHDIGRAVRPSRGGQIDLRSGEQEHDEDVAAYLANFIRTASKGEVRLSRDQVRLALRSSPADSLLLFWRKHELVTRVTNHAVGPEVLFIWRSAERSQRVVDHVVETLLTAYRSVGSASPTSVFEFVRALPPGDTVRASDIMGRFNIDLSASLRLLEQARKEGTVARVYRYRTPRELHHYKNVWRRELVDLPSVAVDEDGNHLHVENAEQVEVGYMRTGEAE